MDENVRQIREILSEDPELLETLPPLERAVAQTLVEDGS